MTKTNQDLPTDAGDVFVAGDTAVIRDTVTKDDGSAKDLSGATVTFGMANRPGDPTVLEKDTSGTDVEVTDAANGKVKITLVPSDTADLGSSEGTGYYYEIEAEDQDSDVATVTAGTFTIQADTV